MKNCWRCEQKAQWRREKLDRIREEAKQQSLIDGKTLVIWKEGTLYCFGADLPEGATAIEYISQQH